MKSIYGLAAVSAIAFAALTLNTAPGFAATVHEAHPGKAYCLTYRGDDSDCSFATLQQCQASASGIQAECVVNVFKRDDSAI